MDPRPLPPAPTDRTRHDWPAITWTGLAAAWGVLGAVQDSAPAGLAAIACAIVGAALIVHDGLRGR
jgi:hypothetical protein